MTFGPRPRVGAGSQGNQPQVWEGGGGLGTCSPIPGLQGEERGWRLSLLIERARVTGRPEKPERMGFTEQFQDARARPQMGLAPASDLCRPG